MEIVHCLEARLWCALPFIINGIWEGLQHAGTIPGTGTFTDCVCGGNDTGLSVIRNIVNAGNEGNHRKG